MTTPRPVTVEHPRPAADPFLDLLARMIRTAHDAEQARRVTLRVMDGGRSRDR